WPKGQGIFDCCICPDVLEQEETMYDEPWGVLQVVANHEKKVARQLAVRSLEHYLPLYTERSRWTDRTVILERPLFPGYVFVRYSPGTRISVISTPGVLKLLGDSKKGMVDSAEVDRIRQALASGFVLRPHPGISVGARVRVCRGIFQGVEGAVTELRRDCDVVIALSAVQQYFSLQVDLRDIEVLSKTGAERRMPANAGHVRQNWADGKMRAG
ncbi:MAG: transcription termination/antitermination NusG family protein, partial [Terriglobia bacterium]|nr:transcription termination/antitermination NusG family protein [Terriglobia bacterium]